MLKILETIQDSPFLIMIDGHIEPGTIVSIDHDIKAKVCCEGMVAFGIAGKTKNVRGQNMLEVWHNACIFRTNVIENTKSGDFLYVDNGNLTNINKNNSVPVANVITPVCSNDDLLEALWL